MSAQDRAECISLITEAVAAGARKVMACQTLDLQIRTIERWEKTPADGRCGPRSSPSNALTQEERTKVLEIANSAEFANLSPCQIVPQLADRGEYVASESSFYRILHEEKLLNHRSKSSPRTNSKPEELVAHEPNQIWSWDITYLKGAIKGTYYYLYLPMDVFSRKIVHWEVHECENAELSSGMIEKACSMNQIQRDQITLHSDNGGPMKGATMLATLQKLGIMPSFSRPSVSDDNPYSESLFKTLKYCPSYPERGFASLEEARKWVMKFVHWYNNVHLHSGINFVTPASRHCGADEEILEKRHRVYELAKAKNPNRWSKETRNWSRVGKVELNPRKMEIKLAA
ncbi:MAG: IS3 family transposase [Nitrospiria bacterium]